MKHFTAEEARKALETLRPLAERMVRLRRDVLRDRAELALLQRSAAGNGGGLDSRRAALLEQRLAEARQELARIVQEIETLGAQVKDLDRGLVDFPAWHPTEGRTVLLCWQLEEADLGYWHGLEEGFAGRKPLPF